MDDDRSERASPSRLARFLRDPLQLRRRARIALFVATLASGLAWTILDGADRSLLLALGWFALPAIAAGLGVGDGFFIEHGRGGRRALLTIIAGSIVALGSCVLLAALSDADTSTLWKALSGALYALLYAALALTLGAILGIAFGRGGGYLARRIQQIDDEGW